LYPRKFVRDFRLDGFFWEYGATQRHAERLYEAEQARQASAQGLEWGQVQVEATPSPRSVEAAKPKSLSMDGGMLHIRGEGWKEMKVARIGTVEPRRAREPSEGEQPSLVHVTNLRYTAVLGEVAPFRAGVYSVLCVNRGMARS